MWEPGLIDFHAHCVPRAYRAAAASAGMAGFDGGIPIPDWDVPAALAFMDRHGIARQVLSLSSPPVYVLAGRAGLRGGAAVLARRANEELASLAAGSGGRFNVTAVLPLPDVDATLQEIDYCFDEIGVCGVTLFSHYGGSYLGNPLFEPVFAALNRRHALVLLHPTSPACADHTRLGRPSPVIEFPIDTVRTVVDLLFAGTLLRYPHLRIVVPHAGAAIPSLAWRIARFADDMPMPDRPQGLTAKAVTTQLRGLYYDLALGANDHAMAALVTIADPARILFGSDYPFASEQAIRANNAELLSSTRISDAAREDIGRNNALALLSHIPLEPELRTRP